ncbi:hypothetical protein CYY_004386 [Polysphondylium violaceum]|uniref:Uncharacterized protein n=1 Tax=Polysphondylium violaceum TaxID=133409 RepID=A0A8J4PWS8_9MYCE|nr:hypothetical protein CYY_004386 [Polysphondylium violaceum]
MNTGQQQQQTQQPQPSQQFSQILTHASLQKLRYSTARYWNSGSVGQWIDTSYSECDVYLKYEAERVAQTEQQNNSNTSSNNTTTTTTSTTTPPTTTTTTTSTNTSSSNTPFSSTAAVAGSRGVSLDTEMRATN